MSLPLFTPLHLVARPNVYSFSLVIEVCTAVYPLHIRREEWIAAKSEGVFSLDVLGKPYGSRPIAVVAAIVLAYLVKCLCHNFQGDTVLLIVAKQCRFSRVCLRGFPLVSPHKALKTGGGGVGPSKAKVGGHALEVV